MLFRSMLRLKQIGKDVDDATESSPVLEPENDVNIQDDSAGSRDGDDIGNSNGDSAEESHDDKPTNTSNKKKRKLIEVDTKPNATLSPESSNVGANDKKKKKKKKKKKNDSEGSNPEDKPEEEVIITLTEQQEAKKKCKKDFQEQKQVQNKTSGENEDLVKNKVTRHISWGAKNRAKSHKASMTALRKAEPPSTKEMTPVKGILRKRLAPKEKKTTKSSSGVLSKQGRKKATSYF